MALTFTKPIEEMPAVTPDELIEYMRKNAPELLDAVVKDLTASDVHQTTALGNEKDKPRSLKERLATMEGKKPDAVDEPDDGATTKAWSIPFRVLKADGDQQLVFGWASVSTKGGVPIVDKQDDIITSAELEKAAYDFVLYSRTQGDMHARRGVGRMVESCVFTAEKQAALGIDLGMEGWWVGFKVDDTGVWKRIKAGELPEFSIGGKGERVQA